MRARMRSTLVTVNVALLAALGWAVLQGRGARGPEGAAFAQTAGMGAAAQGAPGRLRGDYLLLSGRVRGSMSNVTYVVDTANQEMVALTWDRSRRQLTPLGWRSLAEDAQVGVAAPAVRSGGVNR